PRPILVGDGPAAEDGAGGEAARLADVLDEVEEGKVHLGARVGIPDQATVVDRAQGKVHPPVPPGVAELVRRDGEGTEGGGGLALEEAEALRQLGGDEIAQGDVVDEDEEADVAVRV